MLRSFAASLLIAVVVVHVFGKTCEWCEGCRSTPWFLKYPIARPCRQCRGYGRFLSEYGVLIYYPDKDPREDEP